MTIKLALAFDQFVDWVVDCMIPPAVRTVVGTGFLTVLASLSAWPLDSLKLSLVVFCFGISATCALALGVWFLVVCCRYVQHRSMDKICEFNKALDDTHHQRPLDTTETNVLLDDELIRIGVEACYQQTLAEQFARLHAGTAALLS